MANVITFGTEKSKQAILTAARGLGIDVDEAQYNIKEHSKPFAVEFLSESKLLFYPKESVLVQQRICVSTSVQQASRRNYERNKGKRSSCLRNHQVPYGSFLRYQKAY